MLSYQNIGAEVRRIVWSWFPDSIFSARSTGSHYQKTFTLHSKGTLSVFLSFLALLAKYSKLAFNHNVIAGSSITR